jgi:hypothetical protein
VTDVEPATKVRDAMNEINAAQRLRWGGVGYGFILWGGAAGAVARCGAGSRGVVPVGFSIDPPCPDLPPLALAPPGLPPRAAAFERAEAEKVTRVKAAEADAEARYLQGQGIARQRQVPRGGRRGGLGARARAETRPARPLMPPPQPAPRPARRPRRPAQPGLQAILNGLRDSVADFSGELHGVTNKEVQARAGRSAAAAPRTASESAAPGAAPPPSRPRPRVR